MNSQVRLLISSARFVGRMNTDWTRWLMRNTERMICELYAIFTVLFNSQSWNTYTLLPALHCLHKLLFARNAESFEITLLLTPFSSPEAPLLFVSTKNRDLWPGPTTFQFEWLCKNNKLKPEPIRFVRLDSDHVQSDGKSVNDGLPLFDLARGRDSWCWPKGARPVKVMWSCMCFQV